MLRFFAGVMLLVAAVLVYFAVGTLSNIWADDRDDAVAVYLAIGFVDLLAASGSAAIGAWLLREHGRHRS